MKKKLIITFAILWGIISLNAQMAITSSGGKGSGPGGTCSFSIGQVAYTRIGNGTISFSQGVQQSYQSAIPNTPKVIVVPTVAAMVVSTTLLAPISLMAMVYPNPTSDKITLQLDNTTTTANLHYVLYDMKGRSIITGLINQKQTNIALQSLAGGLYILKVYQKAIELKSFKIIRK